MKSPNQSHFANVPRADIQRSSFDRSHGYKTTFDAGFLVPFFVDEALPGDTFNLNVSALARLATPIKPIMDNMFMETFFFAVPNRLVWDNWQKFNGEQENPDDTTDFLIPHYISPEHGIHSLSDYMGIPIGITDLKINSLHHRAYALIWNEWFRDQNLQDSIPVPKGDGPDTLETIFGIQRRGKRHDYFTSCLPWPQKGETVTIPIGGFAPVIGDPDSDLIPKFTFPTQLDGVQHHLDSGNIADSNIPRWQPPPNNGVDQLVPAEWDEPNLVADLASATSITINQLRESFQIQKLYERDARGGTRYTEIIKSHFGVTSPDSRLQRPEYLGGGSTNINITQVVQTTTSDDVVTKITPQGNLAGYGTASINNHGFTKSFTEHCLLIGLVCVRADLTYQQGLNRMWSRQTRWDYYWPALSHIGEQEVLEKEIYAIGIPSDDDSIFGYQERYAEYRYKPSQITGQFRSNYAQSLDIWHLAQDFGNVPVLNSSFIEENPPIDRIIATPDEPHFLFDSYIKLKCARPMPTYGVPGMIDHF